MGNYDDIINLPHHVSSRYSQMSMMGRAAQFAPFSALTGYDETIQDTTGQHIREMEQDQHKTRQQ